jgi:hypothetical protein
VQLHELGDIHLRSLKHLHLADEAVLQRVDTWSGKEKERRKTMCE